MTKKTSRGRSKAVSLSEEDLALWRRVVQTVNKADTAISAPAPLEPKDDQPARPTAQKANTPVPSASRKVRLEGAQKPTSPVSAKRADIAHLSQTTPGLDRRTAQRLKRGKLPPEDRLDMHGMTAARAHSALIGFVQRNYAKGARCILVITGKGGRVREPDPGVWREPQQGAGVLKSLTPQWLNAPPIGMLVTGVYEAHVSHGGSGALYVYLRKNPHARR